MSRIAFLFAALALAAVSRAQAFSDDVTFESEAGAEVTLTASAAADKKKDAQLLAAQSAFNALMHSGVEGFKSGVPMMARENKSYDYRFFSESRYLNFITSDIQPVAERKVGGKTRATVRLTIRWKTLAADITRGGGALNPGWSDAKAARATSALRPTLCVVPDTHGAGSDARAMLDAMEKDPALKHAVAKLTEEFTRRGYKTKNLAAQLRAANNNTMLRDAADTQSDVATAITQNLMADIIVTASLDVTTNGNRGECSLSLAAVEAQTQGNLANKAFASGQYMTTDGITLTDYAIKKVSDDFFAQLKAAFEKMVAEGREVAVEFNLAGSVDGWDFAMEAPATGTDFKEALDDWAREHAFQAIYNMDTSTEKYIKLTMNVPLWDAEKGRSYNLSNFGADLKKFLRAQLGDEYAPSFVAMGQGIVITIK